MTSYQHHYPYFLDLQKLNASLSPHGWHAGTELDAKTKEEILVLRKAGHEPGDHPSSLVVYPRTFIMVNRTILYLWIKYSDGVVIRIYDLTSAPDGQTPIEEFIDIQGRAPGTYQVSLKGMYEHFVTFGRKENLVTPENWHEKYVILHLHDDQLTIRPLTEFNETGGDPMYQWPALASFNPSTGILYGHGMRMGSFEVKL